MGLKRGVDFYCVGKRTEVWVADRKGLLHKHKLKDKMEFWPGFDKKKHPGARQTLVGEVNLDPIGAIGPVVAYNKTFRIPRRDGTRKKTAREFESQGFVIFTTGNEAWPFVVVDSDWVIIHYKNGSKRHAR